MDEEHPPEEQAASGRRLVGLFEFPAGYDEMSEAEKDAFAQQIADRVKAKVEG